MLLVLSSFQSLFLSWFSPRSSPLLDPLLIPVLVPLLALSSFLSWSCPRSSPGVSQSPRLAQESARLILRSFLGGEDQAGRHAGAGKLTLSSSAVSPSLPSSLCSSLCLLQKQSHPSPSPSLWLQPIINWRGTEPPPPPLPSLPLPCWCVSQNYPETTLSNRTGFRGEEEKSVLLPEASAVEPVQGLGGGGVVEVKQWGQETVLEDQRCNLLIRNGSI